jgi:hypothetical protein
MTLAAWILVLAVFLSGAVAGVFALLVVGIHTGNRARHLADEPGTYVDAIARSVLRVGVRAYRPAGNCSAEGEDSARS